MGEGIGMLAFVLLAGGGVVTALVCIVADKAIRAGHVTGR
jgi:hypothetical protein